MFAAVELGWGFYGVLMLWACSCGCALWTLRVCGGGAGMEILRGFDALGLFCGCALWTLRVCGGGAGMEILRGFDALGLFCGCALWTLRVCGGGDLPRFARGLTGASVGGVAVMLGLPHGRFLIYLELTPCGAGGSALPRALPKPAGASPLDPSGALPHTPLGSAQTRRRTIAGDRLRSRP